jgi:hypothetical protein
MSIELCALLVQTALILAVFRIVIRKLKTMPTRADLDAAIAAIASAINDLGTDIQTLITAIGNLPQPGSEDYTAEIGAVQQAAAAVAASKQAVDTEIANITPPPPPPTPGK